MRHCLYEDEFTEVGIDRNQNSIVFSGKLQQRTVAWVGPKLP